VIPDLLALLDQADGEAGDLTGLQEVQEAPQAGQIAGACADEQHIEFQIFPFHAGAGGLGREIGHGPSN